MIFFIGGEGTVSITPSQIVHEGRLAPGPDYKLYLVKDFIEHEDEFLPVKDDAQYVGDVKNFDGFMLNIPKHIKIDEYSSLVIWCEAFSEFITATQYKH